MEKVQKLIVPLVTPFTDDTSSLSEIRLARLIRTHLDQGASGFVVCGRAGEVHALSHAERKQVVEWAVREAKDVPIVVNVSAFTTSAVVDLAQHADRHGCFAAVFAVPPSIVLTPAESEAFVATVKRHGNIQCGYLDASAGSDPGVTTFMIQSLADFGLGDIALSQSPVPDEFAFEGNVVWLPSVFGVNVAKKAIEQWATVEARVRALFGHGGSFRVGKAALEFMGLDGGHTRGPVRDLDENGRQLLESVWKSLS